MVFNLLDSDGDGRISAKKCEIIQIHPLALEIIQDVLFEMETKRKIIDFEGFVEEVTKRELETKIWKVNNENNNHIFMIFFSFIKKMKKKSTDFMIL